MEFFFNPLKLQIPTLSWVKSLKKSTTTTDPSNSDSFSGLYERPRDDGMGMKKKEVPGGSLPPRILKLPSPPPMTFDQEGPFLVPSKDESENERDELSNETSVPAPPPDANRNDTFEPER